MASDQSILIYFINASMVVKGVMLLLLLASIASWTIIFQRGKVLKQARRQAEAFEDAFWSGMDLSKLYTELNEEPQLSGLQTIFHAGFKEFAKLRKQTGILPVIVLEGAQRAMRIAYARESANLEKHLSFLATVGSTSPYVGLFGTVWGIMMSFHALGHAGQATIAMVAPGISEALVATAMGLFAAIPAVIAYNRYASEVDYLLHTYATFQEEFSNVLHRQAHTG